MIDKLTIEKQELDTINDFLKLLDTDLQSIEYISKDDMYYQTNTNENIKDLLSYILLEYPFISDIHINNEKEGISIKVREAGTLKNLNAIFSADNKMVEIDGVSFSTDSFKKHIQNITNKNHSQEDFIDHLSIPLCGTYRIRSSTVANDSFIRLLRLNTSIDESLIKYNVLYLKDNPYYIVDASIIKNLLDVQGSIKLPNENKEELHLYATTIHDFFKHFEKFAHCGNSSNVKLKLEYQKDGKITASILKNYSLPALFKNEVIDYIMEKSNSFYHSVFTHFIDDCTEIKKDETIGVFKSPEALKDYLETIKMLKI